MSKNNKKTNKVVVSRLVEQGPTAGRCSRQGSIGCHYANSVNIIKSQKGSSQEKKIVMGWYILPNPEVRNDTEQIKLIYGLRKSYFGLLEERLVDQENICSNR